MGARAETDWDSLPPVLHAARSCEEMREAPWQALRLTSASPTSHLPHWVVPHQALQSDGEPTT